MSEGLPASELAAFEAALGALRPVAGVINRDRLLFQAGRAAAARRARVWQAATAALTLLAVGLGAAWFFQPAAAETVRYVYVKIPAPEKQPEQAPAPPAPTVAAQATVGDDDLQGSDNYLKLRDQVLRLGVDALPNFPPATAGAPPVPLEQLLDLPPGTLKEPTFFMLPHAQFSGDNS